MIHDFIDIPQLEGHRNTMNNVAYECDLCDYKTPQKNRIITHMIRHISLESRNKVYCRYCPEFFYYHGRRTQHERMVHLGGKLKDQEFVCKCGAEFESSYKLKQHRLLTHNFDPNKYKCKHCGQIEASLYQLMMHINSKHRAKVPCEVCGKMYDQGHRIRAHLRTHSEKKVQCSFEGCGKWFTKAILATHVMCLHKPQESLKCPTCDKEFNNEYRLKVHILRQHNTAKKPCQVPGCNHSTTRTAYLVMHYKNHKDISGVEKERLIRELKTRN
jgi:hypothetical protein